MLFADVQHRRRSRGRRSALLGWHHAAPLHEPPRAQPEPPRSTTVGERGRGGRSDGEVMARRAAVEEQQQPQPGALCHRDGFLQLPQDRLVGEAEFVNKGNHVLLFGRTRLQFRFGFLFVCGFLNTAGLCCVRTGSPGGHGLLHSGANPPAQGRSPVRIPAHTYSNPENETPVGVWVTLLQHRRGRAGARLWRTPSCLSPARKLSAAIALIRRITVMQIKGAHNL